MRGPGEGSNLRLGPDARVDVHDGDSAAEERGGVLGLFGGG